MNKCSIAVIVFILLISLIFEVQPLVQANYYYPRPWGPYIIFNSPTNNSCEEGGAGFTTTLDISVGTITGGQAPGETYELTFSLDGQPYKSLPVLYEGIVQEQNTMSHSVYNGRTSLPPLTEGSHSIEAHCILKVDNSAFTANSKITFNVDNPPQVFILTLDNKTYDTNNITLNFTVSKPFNNLSYGLDGSQQVSIGGNTTIEGLTSGSHILTVCAQDMAGNIGSQTVYFSVRQTQTLSVFVVIILLAFVICIAALVIYLKKYHKTSS